MWTYRPDAPFIAEPAQAPARQPDPPPKPVPTAAPAKAIEFKAVEVAPQKQPLKEILPARPNLGAKRTKKSVKLLALTYLLGLMAGAVGSRFLSQPLLEYAGYYAQFTLKLHQSANKSLVFSTSFLSLFVQFTLVLLLGFCVFGCCLIPAFLLVKGAGTGFFLAFVYSELGAVKGLFMQALVLWLPEVLTSLLAIGLCNCALSVAFGLAQGCLGQAAPQLPRRAKRLLNRYLALCLAGIVPCVLSAALSFVFAGLFG